MRRVVSTLMAVAVVAVVAVAVVAVVAVETHGVVRSTLG